MPIRVCIGECFYEYDNINSIPQYDYDKIEYIEAIDMKINSTIFNKIGLRFPNLDYIDVSCCNIKKLDLSYFHNLKTLKCNKSRVKEIIGFEYCHKLEVVELNCNILYKIESNHNVKELSIARNYLREIPDFNNLEILFASSNPCLKNLGYYPKLKKLLIADTYIKKLDFYIDLEYLECNYTCISELHPYPKLKFLDYHDSLIKYETLPYLPSLKTTES